MPSPVSGEEGQLPDSVKAGLGMASNRHDFGSRTFTPNKNTKNVGEMGASLIFVQSHGHSMSLSWVVWPKDQTVGRVE